MRRAITAVAFVLAALAGAALAGEGDCSTKCDDRQAECESEAESKHDDCLRKIDGRDECACTSDMVLSPKCQKACIDIMRATQRCDAKRDRRTEKCEDKQLRCEERCED
jgi:hypothetical protein